MDNNTLIIMAGGVGKRFGAGFPKQFAKINSRTVLEITISRSFDLFSEVIVMYNKDWEKETKEIADKFESIRLVEGGEEWVDTVGIAVRSSSSENIILLEAARPAFSRKLLKEMLLKDGNVISMKKNNDAIYQVVSNKISKNLPRTEIFNGVTPQKYSLCDLSKIVSDKSIGDAIEGLIKTGSEYSIQMVPETNIKITYPEDKKIIEGLLKWID